LFQNLDLAELILKLPAILFGLAIHEFSHALTATKLGDDTPERQGRLTLNPVAHIDPIGFLMLLVAGFGWAKPVQIDPRAFKKSRRDEILVSIAGPISNILAAVFFVFLLKLMLSVDLSWIQIENFQPYFARMLFYFIIINVVLAVFNMLPIPPLDGSHLISVFIPGRYAGFKEGLLRYGSMIFILIIIAENITQITFFPIAEVTIVITDFLFRIFGIN